jgi:hypothetical protein
MKQNMAQEAFLLDDVKRAVVEEAIKEVCEHRRYDLLAINVDKSLPYGCRCGVKA